MNNKNNACQICTKEAFHSDNLNLREQCINCGNLVVDHFYFGSASFNLAVIAGISFLFSNGLIGSVATILLVIYLLVWKNNNKTPRKYKNE